MRDVFSKPSILAALAALTLASGCSQDRTNQVECRSDENCLVGEYCSDDGECLPEGGPQPDVIEEEDSSIATVETVKISTADGVEDFAFEANGTLQLTAAAFDSEGVELPGLSAEWSSDDESIVTVSESGLLFGASTGDATITATIDEVSDAVQVTVEPPQSGNSAPRADAGEDQNATVGELVTLDASASEDDEDSFEDLSFAWELIVDPSDGADQLSNADTAAAEFTPTEIGDYVAEVTVTDTGGFSDQARVNISVGPAVPCLIISEYIEGTGDYNKALELFNCGNNPVNLNEIGVCSVMNDDHSCSNTMALSGELDAGDVVTLCRRKDPDPNGEDPTEGISDNCQLEDRNVFQHNGDDRFIVFKSDDPSSHYNLGSDLVIDAFGETEVRPSKVDGKMPWQDMTLRRCDFTPYDGTEPFDYTDYYTEHPTNDASDFGTPPVEGC